jgi:hypothetical protein
MKRILAISIKRISGSIFLAAFVIIAMTFNMQLIKAGNFDPKTNEMVKPNPTSELTLHLEPYVYPNGYNVSCYDRKDGSITLTVTGGVQPYSYEWSNREYTKDIDSLAASYYEVRVKDAQGRIASAGITLTPPPKEVSDPIINFDIHEYSPNMNVTCYNCCNGMIEISVTGGSGMYSYQWGDGPTTPDRYGLCQGNYQVVIKDASGCGEFKEHVRNFTIIGPERNDWSMNGNSNSDPSTQFMGTKDNMDFVIRTNDTLRMKIKANGNVGIGTSNPTEKLTVGGNMKVDGKFIVNRITTSDSIVYIGDSCVAIDGNNDRIFSVHYPVDPYIGTTTGGEVSKSVKSGDIVIYPDEPHSGPESYRGFAIGKFAFGNDRDAFAVGYEARGIKNLSMSFGKWMWNIIPNSFMVGFNTGNNSTNTIPSFFVGPSDASGTGKVAIGTKEPTEKFQVDGGNIFIRGLNNFTTDGDEAILYMGDPHHYIKSVHGKGIYIGTFRLGAPNQSFDALFIQQETGNIGIGTQLLTNPNNYKLAVNGTIGAREVKVEIDKPVETWPDFVFVKDYKLTPLEQIEKYISEYKHLPDMPTAYDVAKNGLALGETQALLLKKIEELTLYVIELNKQVEQLKKENELPNK